MKTLIKLLMFLWFLIQYSYSYTPYNPTECSLSRYQGQSKCVKLVYNEVNERLDRTYKNIIENIPRIGDIEVVQEYISLQKSKNEICGKSSNDKIKSDCELEEITAYKKYSETERKCEAAKDEFCYFYWRYRDAPKKISENNASTIKKQYNSWLKSKNDYCKKHSSNEIKLKSCHIDYSIPKLKELWDIESILLEYPFEGKWADCGYDTRDSNLTCRTYFIVEQDDNVCSGYWYRANPDKSYLSIWLNVRVNGYYLYPVKLCYSADTNENASCDILENGYDKQGRMTYKTSVPFLEWVDNNVDVGSLQQYFHKEHRLSTHIKTPFLQGEREELIQTNKWLQDCLNYKGKRYGK